jgi:hypothetical protein
VLLALLVLSKFAESGSHTELFNGFRLIEGRFATMGVAVTGSS